MGSWIVVLLQKNGFQQGILTLSTDKLVNTSTVTSLCFLYFVVVFFLSRLLCVMTLISFPVLLSFESYTGVS